jgi:DNA-binding protein YbaB
MALDTEISRMIEQIGARANDMTGALEAVSGKGSDDDELVTATCGPGNRLIDIEFDPRARRLDNHVLKEKVITAVQRAGEEAQRQLMQVTQDFTAQFKDMSGGADMAEMKQTMEQTAAKLKAEQEKIEALHSRMKSM